MTEATLLATWDDGRGPDGPWPLLWLSFWLLVVAAVVYVVRRRAARAPRPGEGVLAERFARGEIDEEEYRRRLSVLRAKE